MTSLAVSSAQGPIQIDQATDLFVKIFHQLKAQFVQFIENLPQFCLQVALINKALYASYSDLLFPRLNQVQLDFCATMISAIEEKLQNPLANMYQITNIHPRHCVGKVAMCWFVGLALKARGIEVTLHDPVNYDRAPAPYWHSERKKFQKHFDQLLGLPASRAELQLDIHDSCSRSANMYPLVVSPRGCGPFSFASRGVLGGTFSKLFLTSHPGFAVEWFVIPIPRDSPGQYGRAIQQHISNIVKADVVLYPPLGLQQNFPHRYSQGDAKSALIIFPANENVCSSHDNKIITDLLDRIRITAGPDFKLYVLSFQKGERLNSPTPAGILKHALFGEYTTTSVASNRRDRNHHLLYEPAEGGGAWDRSLRHNAKLSAHTAEVRWKPSGASDYITAKPKFKVWSFHYTKRQFPSPWGIPLSWNTPVLTRDGKESQDSGEMEKVFGDFSAVLMKDGQAVWFQVVAFRDEPSTPSYEPGDGINSNNKPPGEWEMSSVVNLDFRVEGVKVRALRNHLMNYENWHGTIAKFLCQFHAMTGVEWEQREQAKKSGLWHFVHHWKVPVACRGGILKNRDRSPKRNTSRRDVIIEIDD